MGEEALEDEQWIGFSVYLMSGEQQTLGKRAIKGKDGQKISTERRKNWASGSHGAHAQLPALVLEPNARFPFQMSPYLST